MHYRSIHGWMDYEDIYDIFINECSDGDTIVEVGSWRGRSLCYLLEKAKQQNKKLDIVAVDTWTGQDDGKGQTEGSMLQEFQDNLIKAGFELSEYRYILEDTTFSASHFQDNSIKCCFIDGNHEYQKVKEDILAWLPKVKDGGILAGHDYTWPDVIKAVDEIIKIEKKRCSWFYRKK